MNLNKRRSVLVLSALLLTFLILRVYLHLSPVSNFDVAGYNIHHLFTGLLLITLGGLPLVLFAGTLLHRGGANRSSTTRCAFSHQYCEPWARQQENFTLSVPRERAKAMSPRLRQLLGYSIHPPFMGQLAARHPEKALADDYVNSLVADDAAIAANRGS